MESVEFKCIKCMERCLFDDDDMQECRINNDFYVDQYLEPFSKQEEKR